MKNLYSNKSGFLIPTYYINNIVGLPGRVKDFTIIILNQLEPSSLSNIELFLHKDVFEVLTIRVDLTFNPV